MYKRQAFHRYSDPPAILTATFASGATVKAYVHPEGVHATISNGKDWVASSNAFLVLQVPYLHILPQIGPLQREEKQLTDDYIDEHYYTRLASRHFRNEIQRSPEHFANFKELAERTWSGLRVDPIGHNNLALQVRDGDFVAEVGWMGHGLQMWLQTMWFLAKTPPETTVVLDEPDVYMHPDLQRKLYRLVRGRFHQAIIATHSVEIMAEADPADILIVNSKRSRSQYANTEPGVQVLIDRLGGIHNVHLARLWNAKRVLLLEGDDLGYLKHLYNTLFPDAEIPLDAIPNWSIGGWNGWSHAIGSKMVFANAAGDRISTYCLLDSDYHTTAEQQERYAQAHEYGINLHIWQRKEIENYLLDSIVIARTITPRQGRHRPTPAEVQAFLLNACDEEKETVLDAMATTIFNNKRSLGLTGANKTAREDLKKTWDEHKLHIVSGKALLARLSEWAQTEYGASLGAVTLARAFKANEIPGELRTILTCIQEGQPFPTP